MENLLNPLQLNSVVYVDSSGNQDEMSEGVLDYDNQSEGEKFALLPLKDISPLPGNVIPIFVGRPRSIKAVDYANTVNELVFLVTQKDVSVENVEQDDLFEYGVLSEIKQVIMLPDKTLKILFECKQTAKLLSVMDSEICGMEAIVQVFKAPLMIEEEEERIVLRNSLLNEFDKFLKATKNYDEKSVAFITSLMNSFDLVYAIIERLGLSNIDRQAFLAINDELVLLEKAILKVNSLMKIIEIERRIKNRLKGQIEKNQKDYYLTEQMKAIQKELGDLDDTKEEIRKIEEKIKTIKLSSHARDTAQAELKKLKHMNQFSSEYSVVKNYLDFLLDLPWGVATKAVTDLSKIKKVLEESHFGMQEVKDRVYELIVQKNRVQHLTKSPVLCFHGAPGIGKTSFAYVLGKAIGYKTISIPLGGVRDESVLRGHRRTYIGSMPGKILQAVKDAGSLNLVIVLDEIGSMGSDWRGNPEDVLLEVLDPMQNNNFQDNYLGTGFDLSGVIFVATTNYVDKIKPALLDRLEVIDLCGYNQKEKLSIAKNYLIPKILKEYGLKAEQFELNDDMLNHVIRYYTYESGVRGLEKQLSKLIRKSMCLIEESGVEKIHVDSKVLYSFLKKPIYSPDEKKEPRIGVVNGLAYISQREGQEGSVLKVESALMPGECKVEFTGNLGDMMKESLQIAFKKILMNASWYDIDIESLKKQNIYLNFPSGGIPKDGPSAGVAIFCSILSAIKKIKFPNDVAMTGEISLYDVLKVGGIKEKLLAAYNHGIKKVFIPYDNKIDLEDIAQEVLSQMEVIPVKTPEEIIRHLGLF